MKRYPTGTPSPYGLYVSMRPLDVRFVGADGEALDGLPEATYRRLPTLLLLAAAPALGGIFVVLFPVLIIAATITGLARLAMGGARKAADEHAWIANPRYAPGAAYLAKGEGKDDETADDEVADLEEEVEARREDR